LNVQRKGFLMDWVFIWPWVIIFLQHVLVENWELVSQIWHLCEKRTFCFYTWTLPCFKLKFNPYFRLLLLYVVFALWVFTFIHFKFCSSITSHNCWTYFLASRLSLYDNMDTIQ
jgi:hypothetical protein